MGPADYMFTTAPDVIRGADLPRGIAAVLSGHIHRHQVLTTDLRGRGLAALVLYPGSIERTSIAEADEEKGFMIVELACDEPDVRVSWQFRPLPARPLVRHDVELDTIADDQLEPLLRALVTAAPADAVLTIRVSGAFTDRASRVLSAASLRALAPPSMNIELRIAERPDVHVRTARPTIDKGRVPDLPLWET